MGRSEFLLVSLPPRVRRRWLCIAKSRAPMSNGNRDRQCALQTIRLVDDEPDAHTKMLWIVNEIATHFFYSSALQVCSLFFPRSLYVSQLHRVCWKKRDYIRARECETKIQNISDLSVPPCVAVACPVKSRKVKEKKKYVEEKRNWDFDEKNSFIKK